MRDFNPPGRSPVYGTRAMVATSHPLAASTALNILRNGGSAADAAVAGAAILGTCEPHMCGIGGDLFVIYWDAKTQKLYGLNASGRSPFSLNRKVFEEKKLDEIPLDGPLCWSVPAVLTKKARWAPLTACWRLSMF